MNESEFIYRPESYEDAPQTLCGNCMSDDHLGKECTTKVCGYIWTMRPGLLARCHARECKNPAHANPRYTDEEILNNSCANLAEDEDV